MAKIEDNRSIWNGLNNLDLEPQKRLTELEKYRAIFHRLPKRVYGKAARARPWQYPLRRLKPDRLLCPNRTESLGAIQSNFPHIFRW